MLGVKLPFFVARKTQHLHFSVKIVFLSAVDPLVEQVAAGPYKVEQAVFFLNKFKQAANDPDKIEHTTASPNKMSRWGPARTRFEQVADSPNNDEQVVGATLISHRKKSRF